MKGTLRGWGLGVITLGLCLGLMWHWRPAKVALAKPSAPGTFCSTYESSPLCSSGTTECTTCHSSAPPALNPFGEQLKKELLPGQARPLSHEDFTSALPTALQKIADLDADGDGVNNLKEIQEGYLPGDKNSKPSAIQGPCETCGYNPTYVYKKVYLDFCGTSPDFAQLEAFEKKEDKPAAIRELLGKCLDSAFWSGKDGVLWRLAHNKVRPLFAVKSDKNEDNQGPVPLADYYDDYNLFVYTQIDNHDAREVLTAQYFVDRADNKDGTTSYKVRSEDDNAKLPRDRKQDVAKEKRAGMMTTRWSLIFFNMFNVIPRATAAQMYRSYLGLDIAKMEGLYVVRNEPADYDNKSVRAAGCVGCHQTLDAMAYPFSRYNGLNFQAGPVAAYAPTRLKAFVNVEGPRIVHVPEAGFILGKRVKDLLEWGKVAANSEQFAKATVMDYWKLLNGGTPSTPKDRTEYETLWKDFKNKYQYSVERMLYALIQTEAYGVQ